MVSDDPEVEAEGQKIEASIEDEINLAWETLLLLPAGRMFIWSIMDQCHFFADTFTGNAQGAYMDGERNVALKIFEERIRPLGMKVFTDMLLEAEIREKRVAIVYELDEADETETDEE